MTIFVQYRLVNSRCYCIQKVNLFRGIFSRYFLFALKINMWTEQKNHPFFSTRENSDEIRCKLNAGRKKMTQFWIIVYTCVIIWEQTNVGNVWPRLDEKNVAITLKRLRNTPPFTSPLVLIALRLRVVITQTIADIPIMMSDWKIPACATTQDRRRKSMTPHMLRRHGISTPCIHPNFIPMWPDWPEPTWPASTFAS